MPRPVFFGNPQCITPICLAIPNASSVIVLIPNTSLDFYSNPRCISRIESSPLDGIYKQGEALGMEKKGGEALRMNVTRN